MRTREGVERATRRDVRAVSFPERGGRTLEADVLTVGRRTAALVEEPACRLEPLAVPHLLNDLRGAQALSDKNFEKVEKLTGWAEERGHTLLELAFAWLLGHPVVSSVIAGATSAEQIQANAATAAWELTPDEVAEVAKLVA